MKICSLGNGFFASSRPFAAGEVAGGVHGIFRLGGNSLLVAWQPRRGRLAGFSAPKVVRTTGRFASALQVVRAGRWNFVGHAAGAVAWLIAKVKVALPRGGDEGDSRSLARVVGSFWGPAHRCRAGVSCHKAGSIIRCSSSCATTESHVDAYRPHHCHHYHHHCHHYHHFGRLPGTWCGSSVPMG